MISSTTQGLETNKWQCIIADEDNGKTTKEGVYAGGDAVTGAATVILAMGEGTILELDKLAGEAVDILVNHKLIAKGEVVVIDENFGVRVTEILSPLERVSDLR